MFDSNQITKLKNSLTIVNNSSITINNLKFFNKYNLFLKVENKILNNNIEFDVNEMYIIRLLVLNTNTNFTPGVSILLQF